MAFRDPVPAKGGTYRREKGFSSRTFVLLPENSVPVFFNIEAFDTTQVIIASSRRPGDHQRIPPGFIGEGTATGHGSGRPVCRASVVVTRLDQFEGIRTPEWLKTAHVCKT